MDSPIQTIDYRFSSYTNPGIIAIEAMGIRKKHAKSRTGDLAALHGASK